MKNQKKNIKPDKIIEKRSVTHLNNYLLLQLRDKKKFII